MVIRIIFVRMGMLILEIGAVALHVPLAVWVNTIILVLGMNDVHSFYFARSFFSEC